MSDMRHPQVCIAEPQISRQVLADMIEQVVTLFRKVLSDASMPTVHRPQLRVELYGSVAVLAFMLQVDPATVFRSGPSLAPFNSSPGEVWLVVQSWVKILRPLPENIDGLWEHFFRAVAAHEANHEAECIEALTVLRKAYDAEYWRGRVKSYAAMLQEYRRWFTGLGDEPVPMPRF